MNQKPNQPIDLAQAEARLQQWCSRHNTPVKVAAAHRKVLLERVSQSMAFENQPVSYVSGHGSWPLPCEHEGQGQSMILPVDYPLL